MEQVGLDAVDDRGPRRARDHLHGVCRRNRSVHVDLRVGPPTLWPMLSIGQKLVALSTLVSLVAIVAVFSPVFALVTLFVAVPLAIAVLRR